MTTGRVYAEPTPAEQNAGATDARAHRAKKRFGQNFLHDPGVIARILRAIDIQPGDRLVEIGPGLGALTVPLLAAAKSLTVVELDRDVIPHLRTATRHDPALTVIEADALTVDFAALAPPPGEGRLRLVGNLPYNISTPLIFHLLKAATRGVVADMHFMLQKEVVDRLCASPDTDAYGRLTVAVAARAACQRVLTVGPGAFRPAPKVDSAVVRITPRPPAYEIGDGVAFDRVVTGAFSQRRKTLSNALKGTLAAAEIVAAGIDPGRRAETLAPADFARLAARLSGSS